MKSQFWGPVASSLHQCAKSKCQQGCSSSGNFQKESINSLFQIFPWLSTFLAIENTFPTSAPMINLGALLCLLRVLPASLCKDSVTKGDGI